MNIGIFGITANPPHFGHIEAIRYALEKYDISEVWVTPVYNHAFNKKFIDYDKRLEMLHNILLDFSIKNVKIKEIDKEYYQKHKGVVYSYNLLNYLKDLYVDKNFSLVIGEDNYKPNVWKNFYEYEKIEKEFKVLVVPDKGVHSTHIREYVNTSPEKLEGLLGKRVMNFILKNDLYQRGNV